MSNSIGTFAVVLLGLEVFSRLYLGLGTPPPSVAHPTIENMFAPGQDVYRFGSHQIYNEQDMRSVPLLSVAAPRVVLVMGGSREWR